MAQVIEDRVKSITTTTGTGSIVIAGSILGFRPLSDVCDVGDTFYGSIVAVNEDDAATGEWEVGYYTYSAENTVERTRVDSSSNNNQLVNFSAGRKNVCIEVTAAQVKRIYTNTTDTAVRPTVPDPTIYTSVVFQEEFSGLTLDSSKFNTFMWYTSDDATKNYDISDGSLRVWSERNAANQFFNRAINTDGKYYQRYGFFEIEAVLPVGYGLLPSYWLMAHNDATRPELAVMQAFCGGYYNGAPEWANDQYQPINYRGMAHDGNVVGQQQLATILGARNDLHTKPHKFGLHWSPTEVIIYFDGQPIGAPIDITNNTILQQRMFMVLSLWTGNFSGNPNSPPTNVLPPSDGDTSNAFKINYVRAWRIVGITPQSDESPPMGVEDPTQPSPAPAPDPAPAPEPGPSPAPEPGPAPSPSPNRVLRGPDPSLFGSSPTFFDDFDTNTVGSRWNDGVWYRGSNPPGTWRIRNSCLEMCATADVPKDGRHDFGYVIIDSDPDSKVGNGFKQRYGAFQCECKQPIGKGWWPSFWLLGHPGSARPEIDVFESYPGGDSGSGGWSTSDRAPHPKRTDWAVHPRDTNDQYFGARGNANMSGGRTPEIDLSAAFHTYTVTWDENEMRFYFDGILRGLYNDPAGMTYFRNHGGLYVMFQYGLAGAVAGAVSTDTSISPVGFGSDPANPTPNVFRVSYVSVWQFKKYGG